MASSHDNPLKRLIREIHRRSLWQVMGIYVAASWVAFEVVETLTDGLGLPGWFPGFAFVLLLIGFPIVLATAFVQEGGPQHDALEDAVELDEIFSEGDEGDEDEDKGVAGLFTWRNALLGGVGALALWGLVAAGWLLLGHPAPGGDGSPLVGGDEGRPTVAVLPFENLSANQENEFFADGVHEDILTQLSKVGDLIVLSRTSVTRYEDTDESIETIARELDADAVLEGSVRRANRQIRISAQLIDPTTGGHVWAETYDRRLDDVFEVQSDVARRVSDALRATLSPAEADRIAGAPTDDLTAYDLYLQGREAYKAYEEEANEEAIRLYRRALELDPDYALAFAGLANALGQRVERFNYPLEWADSSLRVARRAVEHDPELAEGHKALGLAYSVQGRHRRALEAYREAIRLDPNHNEALQNAGIILYGFGRYPEAVRVLERATRVAPREAPPHRTLAYTYKYLELDERARESMERARELDPDNVLVRLFPANYAIYEGRPDSAVALAERIVRAFPEDAQAWTTLAGVAYMARDHERAAEAARESLRLEPDNEHLIFHSTDVLLGASLVKTGARSEGRDVLRTAIRYNERRIREGSEHWRHPWHLAAAHGALGDEGEALDWLERAYDSGFRFVRWPPYDPALDAVRDASRYERLMERMEADVDSMRQEVLSQSENSTR